MQTRPTLVSLVCSSYSSDRDFASDFLQILLHSRHPCHWLVVPNTKPTTDFHRQVVAHAGRTSKRTMHYYIVLILYQYYNSVLTSILSALIASITSLTFAIVSSLKFGFSLGIPTASFLASNLNT